jgi:branched-chain amino acid transport system substrate-binding protein
MQMYRKRDRLIQLSVWILVCAIGTPALAQLDGRTIKIGIGAPLTGVASGFGVEMQHAVELAITERNAAHGILGAGIEATSIDDKADSAIGAAAAQRFCDDPAVLGVVGHVNSGVSIAAAEVYHRCGLLMITPMSSNPDVTEHGFANVFRLTNRDDRKGPALAAYLREKMDKRKVVAIDDGTAYGKGLAESFAAAFQRNGGEVAARLAVKVGDKDFAALLKGLPADFDVLLFAGIAEAAPLLKQMRDLGMNQLFACGDGCWDVKGFIIPSAGAATTGEGVRILSAAPAVGTVPGSRGFADRYIAKYGPIGNYAPNSYDAARLVMLAIERAGKAKGGSPTRPEVVAAMRTVQFQGIAYARPVTWDAKGDNSAAVIFVNVVEGDRFKEIAEIQ